MRETIPEKLRRIAGELDPGPAAKHYVLLHDAANAICGLREEVKNLSAKAAPKPCRWMFDEDTDSYDTRCGGKYVLISGTLGQNHMVFCPYCGGKLTLQPNTGLSRRAGDGVSGAIEPTPARSA